MVKSTKILILSFLVTQFCMGQEANGWREKDRTGDTLDILMALDLKREILWTVSLELPENFRQSERQWELNISPAVF